MFMAKQNIQVFFFFFFQTSAISSQIANILIKSNFPLYQQLPLLSTGFWTAIRLWPELGNSIKLYAAYLISYAGNYSLDYD